MKGQEVGTGGPFPSLKKGMVAPVEREKLGAEGLMLLCGNTRPGA